MSFYPGTPYGSAPDAVNGYRGTSVAVSGTRAYVVQATSTGWDAGLYPTLVVYDISGMSRWWSGWRLWMP